MTIDELKTLKDILHWAEMNVKTDGMFVRIGIAKKWVDRDLLLKTMNPVKSKESEDY